MLDYKKMKDRIRTIRKNSQIRTLFSWRGSERGITLVETLIGAFVFLLIAVAVYQSYGLIFKLIGMTRLKTAAFELAQEQVETIRNMPYADIGIISGVPVGTIPRVQDFTRSGYIFRATTTVRNIDDPFDGTIGGLPNDLSPADHKIVELLIGCVSACVDFTPIEVTTTVAPRSLETTTGNGAIFVEVIDANGQPVPSADVTIQGQGTSTVSISELTNTSGIFQLVDVIPGSFLYKITASKNQHSTETTYTPGAVANPNPTFPHATVAAGVVTRLTLAIDQISTITVRSVNETCAPIPFVPFTITGQKKIGTAPDVYKYTRSDTTDANGQYVLSNVEWDTYDFTLDGGNTFSGTIPFVPFPLSPNVSQDLVVVPKPLVPDTLLVKVRDKATKLPIADASVTLSRFGYTSTLQTNRGFFLQSDWSGGTGETYFSAGNMFDSTDSGIEYLGTPGEVSLKNVFGTYVALGTLTSSWFDVGTASTTLYGLDWLPISQNPLAGADSVKFQLETRDDIGTPLGGFIGPDGTSSTYYTTPGTAISSDHTNKRYVRYKMYLSTADSSVTPLVSDVSLTFGTNCTPFGQVFYSGLLGGAYTVDVTAPGYANYTDNVTVNFGANSIDVELEP